MFVKGGVMMSNLIEFFNQVTGLDILNLGSDPIKFVVVVFGFLICYDVVHIVFSSLFDFTYKR